MLKRILTGALLVCTATLRVAAQAAPPQVSAITPAVGATSGGNAVTVTGANLSLPPNFACILGCPTVVRFGDVEVEAKEETNTRVVVLAPAHVAGTVDVTVRTGDGRQTTVAAGYTFADGAQDAYESVLLPVYTDGKVSGQHGSEWQTTFWIHNEGGANLLLAPWDCPDNTICLPVFPMTKILQPHESHRGLPVFFRVPNANPGRMLYVSRGGNFAANLRLADTSRRAIDGGTEIPVVRERDLHSRTLNLLNVPFAGESRILVRIYDVALGSSSFKVSIYGQDEGLKSVKIYETEVKATTSDTGDFRVQPAYAQVSGFESSIILPVVPPEALRVEVTPLSEGSRFWAFASVTNNATQHVTVVTP